jgi:hypothetical protein
MVTARIAFGRRIGKVLVSSSLFWALVGTVVSLFAASVRCVGASSEKALMTFKIQICLLAGAKGR